MQSTTTVLAPCGTSCPSAAPDKIITRSAPAVSEGTPCPSLIVSSISGNGTNPTAPGQPKTTAFTGGAQHIAGSVAAAAAAGAAVVAFAL